MSSLAWRKMAALSAVGDAITYLPATTNPVIGNFFDNSTSEMSFIQCYMHCLGTLKGVQYGIGYPVDTPVLLTQLNEDATELKPVLASFPDYDNLINHVASQMDYNDFQLYKTPVVLTLQGYFDEDDDDEGEEGEEEEEGIEELDEEEEEDEEDEEEEDDGEDDGEDGRESSFWNSSPVGKMNETYAKMPDFTIVRGGDPKVNMANDSTVAKFFVTEEDTASMKLAHKRADRITREASDVSLIASFHWQKENFHLVKLLDPIFVVGRRIDGIKGYYFSLLDNSETPSVTPALERLIFDSKQQLQKQADGGKEARPKAAAAKGVFKSRRRWTTRGKKSEE